MHVYEVRPRKDKRGVDLISDVLPWDWLRYYGPNAISNAIAYAEHFSRSHNAVYDVAGNVIETHEHKGDFQRMMSAEAWPSAAPHSFINSHNTEGARQPTPDAVVPPAVTYRQ